MALTTMANIFVIAIGTPLAIITWGVIFILVFKKPKKLYNKIIAMEKR